MKKLSAVYNINFAVQMYRMLVGTNYADFGSTTLPVIQDLSNPTEDRLYFNVNSLDPSSNDITYQASQLDGEYSTNFAVQFYKMLVGTDYTIYGNSVIPSTDFSPQPEPEPDPEPKPEPLPESE